MKENTEDFESLFEEKSNGRKYVILIIVLAVLGLTSVYAFLSDHLGSVKRSLEGDLAHFSASIDCHFSDT